MYEERIYAILVFRGQRVIFKKDCYINKKGDLVATGRILLYQAEKRAKEEVIHHLSKILTTYTDIVLADFKIKLRTIQFDLRER